MQNPLCLCGCGKETDGIRKYVRNHKKNAPDKFCECGCGEKLSNKSKRFIFGHSSRGVNNSNYGKTTSIEVREKISNSLTGYKHTEEFRQKQREVQKGRVLTETHKQNIGKSLKGKPKSEEHCKHISESRLGKEPWNKGLKGAQEAWNKGIPRTDEEKQNISVSLKGKYTGEDAAFYGHKHTEESRELIRLARSKQVITEESKLKRSLSERGEKNPNWQGGKSFEEYPQDWFGSLKKNIRKRDNFTCQLCGKSQNQIGEKLSVHHIDYNKTNLDENNLISLCRKCHARTGNKQNRKYWTSVFTKFMQLKLSDFNDSYQSYYI